MNILVTGCAGFIGSKVCELLLNEGHVVYGLDNFSDAYDLKLKHYRINRLKDFGNFNFSECDISDNKNLNDVVSTLNLADNKSIEAIMNLAARAGVRQSAENPWIYYSTNVIGTLNLLELAKTSGIKKFVLASTSSVYGTNELPFKEDSPTDFQLSQYASSKKSAEGLCFIYNKNYDIDISILRYFTVYGPSGRPDMSIFRFIKWIAEDSTIEIFGDGNQMRDFTYIDDIAKGTILALKNIGFEIINLGSGNPASINQVISTIEDVLQKKGKIIFKDKHPADIDSTCADTSKAKRLLDWTPKTDLKTGLMNSINWYEENSEFVSNIEV